ncbi:MAG: Fe-S protein assembly co-chaperone HscB [Bacteroidia bacterium]|nr:MAG: Fe-S protein assembly co-chaperone HscB [Bacteroidia bacterium]
MTMEIDIDKAKITTLIDKDFYQLFNLEPDFNLDLAVLKLHYHQLQQQYHPDNHNHINTSEINKKLILQLSAHINKGYETLTSALTRALYLLSLNEVSVDLSCNNKMDYDFLNEQIELREVMMQYEQVHDIDKLEVLEHRIMVKYRQICVDLQLCFAKKHYNDAVLLVRKLAFFEKLSKEVSDLISGML